MTAPVSRVLSRGEFEAAVYRWQTDRSPSELDRIYDHDEALRAELEHAKASGYEPRMKRERRMNAMLNELRDIFEADNDGCSGERLAYRLRMLMVKRDQLRSELAAMRAERASMLELIGELLESVHDLHYELCKYYAYGEVPPDSNEGKRAARARAAIARAQALASEKEEP